MKKTVRRVLSLAMVLCLVLSLAAAAFAAEETTVATAQELKTALGAGGAIKLGDNIDVGEALTVSMDTVLDLNGHTLAVDHDSRENYAVLVSAALTVKDSSAAADGKITSATANTLFLDYGENAANNSLTLLSGTVENTCLSMGDTAIVAVGSTISALTISGGTVYSEDGDAIFAQAATLITGGFFHGEVYLARQVTPGHQVIAGGYYDLDPGFNFDFYGQKYEVVEDEQYAGYPYKVQEIPESELVTVNYEFPAASLQKAPDYFRKNSTIEMPDAPYYVGYRFVSWYQMVGTKTEALIFPYEIKDNMTFHAKYIKEAAIPEGFFDKDKPLNNLVIGDTYMVKNGVVVQEVYTIENDTGTPGTATVGYENDVYTLTLDTFFYEGPGGWMETADSGYARSGIYAEGNLLILLKGDNRLILESDETDTAGMQSYLGISMVNGSLAIADDRTDEETGTLSIGVNESESDDSGRTGMMAIGLYVDGGDLGIYRGDVFVQAGNALLATGIAAGLNSEEKTGNLVVGDGGELTVSLDAAMYAAGIAATGDITVDGISDVRVFTESVMSSAGVQCGDLTVMGSLRSEDGGMLTSTAVAAGNVDILSYGAIYAYGSRGGAATMNSAGLRASGSITVDNGYLFARGGDVTSTETEITNGESYGIVVSGSLTAGEDGWIDAAGGDVDGGVSCGISAGGELTVEEDGWVFCVGGDVAGAGESIGADFPEITVFDGGELRGFGGDVGFGDSTGISVDGTMIVFGFGTGEPDEEYEEHYAIGAVYGRGGDTDFGDSYGLHLADGMLVQEDGAVHGYGGDTEDGDSYGIYSEGDVTIDLNSQVYAYGGAASDASVGAYIGAMFADDCTLALTNSGQLEAVGGDAGASSIGLMIDGGVLKMEKEDSGALRLDATGGTAPRSVGVDIFGAESGDRLQAILMDDTAMIFAEGGDTVGDNALSCGVYACGDITVAGESMLVANSALDALNGAGIAFDGPYDLTLADSANVMARAYNAEKQSGAIIGQGGKLSVPAGCGLFAGSGKAAEGSVAISGFETLVTGGIIAATAGASDTLSVGIMLPDDPGGPIAITHGQLAASGKTAAICGMDDDIENPSSITVTAPHIEYSTVFNGPETTVVEPEAGTATLEAGTEHKLVMALADGPIGNLVLTDVNTSLTFGAPVSFTAKLTPHSYVKVEEERWVRSDGAAVSSKSSATPGAGTYSYELILVPEEGFSFAEDDDGVGVTYNGKYYEFHPQPDGKLILSNAEAGEVFVPDVTVDEPYAPVFPSGGTSSTEDKKTEEGMVQVELPAQAGQMVVIVGADGTLTPVLLSYTENGVAHALVPAGATVRVVDAKPMSFGDVKATDWFAGAVDFVTSHGIFQGTDRGFEPNVSMNRAMMATVLFRISGETAPAGGTAFGDVKASDWFAQAVAWASDAGIVNGRGTGFAPDAPVTREEIATMLYRFMQHMGLEVGAGTPLTGFPDGAQTSPWAQDAMQWAVSAGLFQGDETGALNPGGEATRAEVATLVERLVKLIVG